MRPSVLYTAWVVWALTVSAAPLRPLGDAIPEIAGNGLSPDLGDLSKVVPPPKGLDTIGELPATDLNGLPKAEDPKLEPLAIEPVKDLVGEFTKQQQNPETVENNKRLVEIEAENINIATINNGNKASKRDETLASAGAPATPLDVEKATQDIKGAVRIPDAKEVIPNVEDTITDAKNKIPSTDETTPNLDVVKDVKNTVPDLEGVKPKTVDGIPDINGGIPKFDTGNIPKIEIPKIDTPALPELDAPTVPKPNPPTLPNTKRDIPDTISEVIPDTDKIVQDVKAVLPDLTGANPNTEEPTPEIKETVPEIKASTPDINEVVPGADETVPEVNGKALENKNLPQIFTQSVGETLTLKNEDGTPLPDGIFIGIACKNIDEVLKSTDPSKCIPATDTITKVTQFKNGEVVSTEILNVDPKTGVLSNPKNTLDAESLTNAPGGIGSIPKIKGADTITIVAEKLGVDGKELPVAATGDKVPAILFIVGGENIVSRRFKTQ
ncbi:hypothetical protein TWF506_000107 [Arthrobotrys conoides]|uniref:Uncharacterized protein n=1 Tax=Arthrobotrys conoides TaxID=74498 RepID=A0AAN8S0N3_9PEZI